MTTPAAPDTRQEHLDDESLLHRLGYAQELFRSMGGFSNFAISFTIISILAGCLTSYFIAFNNGGPIAITWGWLIVGAFCIVVSLAMGEIASAYPTAGGLYYWASRLGSPAWGWFTGWFNLIGQIAVTAAIGYGLAIFATSLLNLLWGYPNNAHWIFVTYTVVMAVAGLVNMLGVPITARLNDVSAWWHMIGVLVIVGILIVVPDHHQSVGYVFGKTINNSGFSGSTFAHPVFWFVFGIGLLMAQYTITGYDASAHMSEETRQASRGAAVGMVMSVVASVIFGFILLVAVTFAVPDTKGTLGAVAYAVTYIWQNSMSTRWAEFLLFIACVAQLFCTIASVTSASRMNYAFSRDHAVPGWQLWRRISHKERIPVYSVWFIVVLSWALMLPTLSNAAVGYLVGTSIAVIGLYIAFGIPIYLRLRNGDRFEHGAWQLGRHYRWIGWTAIAWITLICILFLMPTVPTGIPWKKGFDWNVVNYAPLTVGGALVFFGGWWLISANKWFTGPRRQGSDEELARIEAQYGEPTRPQPGPEPA
jgi:amino acid transporter